MKLLSVVLVLLAAATSLKAMVNTIYNSPSFVKYIFCSNLNFIRRKTTHSQTVDELKMMQAVVVGCIASEGATDEDAANVFEMLVPQARTAMCLNACIMEKTGIVSVI